MPGITTVSDVAGRWFAVVVLAAGAVALAAPDLFAGWHRGGALVSVAAITAVVAVVVAASASTLLTVGALVVVAVVLHNVLGLVLGYAIARGCGLDASARRAVSIEVGMQNSGLAAALATVHFSPAAALPAAIFSVWHNVSGSLLASSWSRRDPDDPRRAHVASARRLGRPLQDEARR